MSRYIALAHRGDTGSWGISFPDFLGCISAADSFEDVVEQGAEALRFHVEGLLEDGEAIPEPRPLEVLRADPEFADDFVDAIVTVVPLLPPRDRPMRVNVILDANLLARIDDAAKRLDLNRSEFLAEGARRLILTPEKAERRAAGIELSEFAGPVRSNPGRIAESAGHDPVPPRGEAMTRINPARAQERPVGRDPATGAVRSGKRVIKGLTKGTTKR